jgi:predicted acyltransferase
VLRGATIAAMLLVNDPGSWSAIFPPLRHAEWNGCTPTDLIFPFFLFIVGITTTISVTRRRAQGETDPRLTRQVIRRGAVIVLLGLLISWVPFYSWNAIPGVSDPTVGQRIADRLLHVRIPGILQRIGIAYVAAALVTLRTSLRAQVIIVAGILLGYWALLTLVPVPGTGATGAAALAHPSLTLAAWLDRTLLDWGAGGNHLWAETRTWDPEGPLSTLPAIATAMLGVLAGRWLLSDRPLLERITGLVAAGSVATTLGLAWGLLFPINKNLWTSSYVLFTAGLASLALGACAWLADGRDTPPRWTTPFVIFGVNPIVAFVGAELTARLIYSVIRVPSASGPVSLEQAIYQNAYAPFLPPRVASFAFAMTVVLVWLAVLGALYRKRIVLKV